MLCQQLSKKVMVLSTICIGKITCLPTSLLLLIFMLFWETTYPLSINSSLPILPDYSIGINCRGSILCPNSLEFNPPDYIGVIIKITNGSATYCPSYFSCGPLNDTDIYLANDHIVCLPLGQSFLGGICAFAQGSNVPATGVDGALIKRKLQELKDHECSVCGSVPLGGDNDPGSRGILTVNYIGGVACNGLCPSRHFSTSLRFSANGSSLLANRSSLLES